MAKDPICRMDVNEKTAQFKMEHAGKTYYFCSKACMETFKTNLKKYV